MSLKKYTIQSILTTHWDPLNIGDNIKLKDEYDAYIPEILHILDTHDVSLQQVMDYLLKIENVIHSTISDSQRKTAAELLLAAKKGG